jgi:hypothetical protein
VNAEAFINKASLMVTSSQHEVLNLQYKVYFWDSKNLFTFIESLIFFLDISVPFQGLLCKGLGSEKKILGSCTSIL